MQSHAASMTTITRLDPSLTGRIRISTMICYAPVAISVCIASTHGFVYAWGQKRSCGFTSVIVVVARPIIGRKGVNPMNVFGSHE
jgi:hypothetical protein